MFHLLRSAKTNRNMPRISKAHLRQWLEFLEDRTLPSTFTPIPLGSAASRTLASVDPTYPTGNLTFAGVPFQIATTGNNVVWNNDGPSSGTIIKNFPVGVAGVTQVQTLMNTTFGQFGPNSYLKLEFFGSAGADYTLALIGNVDVRDLNNYRWTNSINGTTTINVFNTALHYRMDKQTIDLPPEFASQTLTSIRMIDTGRFDFQRGVLYGITVAAGSPDIAATSVAWNTAQGGVDFSYTVSGAALTQNTTAALYWASGPNVADRIGGPLYTLNIDTSAKKNVGTHGAFHVDALALGIPPLGTTRLLLVVDPGDIVLEADEANNTRTMSASVIAPLSTTPPEPEQLPYNEDLLDPSLRTAVGTFRTLVQTRGGTFTPTSGLRSTVYQAHFYELRTKFLELLKVPGVEKFVTVHL